MRSLALTAAAVIGMSLPQLALAQPVVPAPVIAEGHATLTVTGQGETSSKPDVAVFSAGVQTQAATAAQALAQNSREMEKVIAALKRSGIADRDIQTNNLSINPVYSDPEREARMSGTVAMPPRGGENLRRIIGYEVSNNVMVRQRDLKNFGKVIDTLVSAGANQVNGPNFQLEDQADALNKARIEAMGDARKNAQLYAQAAGMRIVRILTISDGGGYSRPQPMFARVAMEAAAPAPIAPGEVSMTASVTVTYELAP